MMDEADAVDDSEFVLRRIHRSFFVASDPTPVWPWAFRPNANDLTGISVFRAALTTPTDILASIEASKRNDYYVARLSVQALRGLGLTVEPDPVVGGPRGHAVIPELAWAAYQANKQHFKPILIELAKLASTDIVHSPS